jgi:hypothetical protein
MRIKKEGDALPPLGCLFLKLSDDQKKIVLDKTFEAGSLEFEKLKEELPKDEGRYVLYDYAFFLNSHTIFVRIYNFIINGYS